MSRARTIRAHLLALVLVVVLPFVGLLSHSIWRQAEDDSQRARDTAASLAQLTAANVQQFMADAESIVSTLARRPLIRDMDPKTRDTILDEFLVLYPQFANVLVVDLSGHIIYTAVPQQPETPVSVADRPWFQTVLRKKKFTVGPPTFGKITHRWVSVLAHPIQDEQGNMVGAMGLSIDLTRYQNIFRNVVLPPGAAITIVDSDGTVVTRSLDLQQWLGKPTRGTEIVDLVLKQANGQTRARGVDGTERFYAFTAIAGTGWHAYAGIPTARTLAAVRGNAVRSSLVALAVVAMVGIFAGTFSRQIIRPILALTRAVGAAAQGRLETRVPVEGPTEIATVAREFNQMLAVRFQTEQALRWSRERLRAMVDSALDCIVTIDHTGKILEFNPAAERIFGYRREEAIGSELAELLIPPALREQHRRGLSGYLTTGEAPVLGKRIEMSALRADGTEFPVELSITRVGSQEPPIFTGFVRDITARKQAEKRSVAMSQLGHSLSSATSREEAARIIVNMADKLFGWDVCSLDLYSPAEDMVHPILNIDTIRGERVDVPPAYQDTPPSPMARRVIERGEELVLRQEPFAFSPTSTPFGNTHRPSASLMYVPIRNAQQVIGILSIQSYAPNAYKSDDLATLKSLADYCGGAVERIRAEEEIRRLKEELEQRVTHRTAELSAANRELETFAYSVSHDLRAPLRGIDGFSLALLEEYDAKLDDQGRNYLQRIRANSQRMGKLIDDLLELSRTARGEMRREPTDLSTLARAIATDLQSHTTNEPPRQVEFVIAEGIVAEGDMHLLRLVLENLLRNAWKFTSKRARARIEFGQTQQEGVAVFFVRDDGAGFDMAYAGKLFGAFQRLHAPSEFTGTGVGLATVQRIIHRHGGRVWAESEVDKGAIFYFTLS